MEKSYYKRELGDGSAISVVKTWCAAAEASGEPVANGVATALLRAGKTKKEKAE